MLDTNASVYWIRLQEHVDPTNEGYIGVSINLEHQLKRHRRLAQSGKHKNIYLKDAVLKHGWDNLVKEVLFTGDEISCYSKEAEIRPNKNIGWNMSPGVYKTSTKDNKKETRKNENNKRNRLIVARSKKRLAKAASTLEKQRQKEIKRQQLAEQKERIAKEREIRRLKRAAAGTLNQKSDRSNRPMCSTCNKHCCTINYVRKGKTYYRSTCNRCNKNKPKKRSKRFNWEQAGYAKKSTCDLCGFKSLYPSQITVFHIDGNLTNTAFNNLRSICLNCVEVVKKRSVTWKRGDLQVDY